MGFTAEQLKKTATRCPKKGEFVLYYPIGTGNLKEVDSQIAMVTRVISPDVVNLQIFYDAAQVTARSVVPRRGSEGADFSCWDYQEKE